MDFSVCLPRWLWQRLWEGEIIPTTDINLFLCLKTRHSTTQSICGNCEDNNSWRKKLDKLWTILSFLPLLLWPVVIDHHIITTLSGIARVTMDQYGYHKIIFLFYIVACVKSSLRNHAPIIAFVKSSLRNHAPLENGQALLKCSQIQTSQCHKIHSKLFKNKLASSKLR